MGSKQKTIKPHAPHFAFACIDGENERFNIKICASFKSYLCTYPKFYRIVNGQTEWHCVLTSDIIFFFFFFLYISFFFFFFIFFFFFLVDK